MSSTKGEVHIPKTMDPCYFLRPLYNPENLLNMSFADQGITNWYGT